MQVEFWCCSVRNIHCGYVCFSHNCLKTSCELKIILHATEMNQKSSINHSLCIFYACSVVKMMIMLCFKHFFCINTVKLLPWEQRLHFRCVSWRAKNILRRHPFKSVQKSGRINFKKRVFSCSWPVYSIKWVLRESCVADES